MTGLAALAREAMGAYLAECGAAGVDAEAELLAVRFEHGQPVAVAVAGRLAHQAWSVTVRTGRYVPAVASKWAQRALGRPDRCPLATAALLNDASFDARRPEIADTARDPGLLTALAVTPGCQRAVARNHHTPAGVLAVLVDDPDDTVRAEAAANRNTPAAVLETCARSDDTWVRAAVARNPATSRQLLDRLFDDPSIVVRHTYANLRRARPRHLVELTRDTHDDVRRAAIYNPALPLEHLNTLQAHPHPQIRSHAQEAFAQRTSRVAA